MPIHNESELRRNLTLPHATSLVVGIVIGTGVFLKAAVMAQEVGSPALVLGAWIAAGLYSVAGALSLAELAAMMPLARGQYVLSTRSLWRAGGVFFQLEFLCRRRRQSRSLWSGLRNVSFGGGSSGWCVDRANNRALWT